MPKTTRREHAIEAHGLFAVIVDSFAIGTTYTPRQVSSAGSETISRTFCFDALLLSELIFEETHAAFTDERRATWLEDRIEAEIEAVAGAATSRSWQMAR